VLVVALVVFVTLASCAPANEVTNEYDLNYKEGLEFYESRDFYKAIASLSKAINLQPESMSAYLLRGKAYRHVYEYEKALQDIDKVLELDPNNYDAHVLRGTVFFNTKKYEEAINEYTIALELSKENKEALLYRGFTYSAIEEYHMAIYDFQQYLIFVPDSPDRARIEAMIESLESKIEK